MCARVPSVRSGAQMFWSNGSLDGLVPLNRISLCRSCVFLRKDLCTADPVSPCAEILRASVHVIPSGSFLRTVQRPWPYLVCCDSQPLARGCARSIRWCGGYAEAVSESGAMNRAFSRVPATGRNGVARQNWGSFWHVLAVCVARFSSWQILIKPESAVKYCSLVVCVSKLCPKLQMQVRCKKLKTHLFSGLWKNKTAAFARFSVADAPNISNQCCKLRWFVPPLPLSFRSVSTLRGSYGRS